jgi:hypothetical protein
MKQTVLRYGLIAGAIAAVLMLAMSLYFKTTHDYLGYGSILTSMLFVYFGVRDYREKMGGILSFGKGFQVGILIALISCLCYVVMWMIVYETLMPDFMDIYAAQTLEQLRQAGASEVEIERSTAEMASFKEMYKQPLIRFGLTFMEPLPVGLGVALVSAWMLRRSQ